jgi:hypothetical protein
MSDWRHARALVLLELVQGEIEQITSGHKCCLQNKVTLFASTFPPTFM